MPLPEVTRGPGPGPRAQPVLFTAFTAASSSWVTSRHGLLPTEAGTLPVGPRKYLKEQQEPTGRLIPTKLHCAKDHSAKVWGGHASTSDSGGPGSREQPRSQPGHPRAAAPIAAASASLSSPARPHLPLRLTAPQHPRRLPPHTPPTSGRREPRTPLHMLHTLTSSPGQSVIQQPVSTSPGLRTPG